MEETSQNQIYRLNQVIELTGISRSSIYAFMQDGKFPKAKKLGPRAVGWHSSDIHDWIEKRA